MRRLGKQQSASRVGRKQRASKQRQQVRTNLTTDAYGNANSNGYTRSPFTQQTAQSFDAKGNYAMAQPGVAYMTNMGHSHTNTHTLYMLNNVGLGIMIVTW